jgi:hypothetical protein
MEGDIEQKPLTFREKPQHRELTIFAPEQDISGSQIEALYQAFSEAQAGDPGTLESFSVYSERASRRLVVRLGVVGMHTQLHETAVAYSCLMTDKSVLPQHGRHDWRIDH